MFFPFFYIYIILLLFPPLPVGKKNHVAACILLWFVKGLLLQNLDPDVLLVGAC